MVLLGIDEVLDLLLDQEGLEVDPLDRLDKETPLHKAVRFVNELPQRDWDGGKVLVELLLDAGADPRLVISLLLLLCSARIRHTWRLNVVFLQNAK